MAYGRETVYTHTQLPSTGPAASGRAAPIPVPVRRAAA
jgi:hypothetical protein